MDLLELFQEIQKTALPETVLFETPTGNYLYNPALKKYDLLPPDEQKKRVESRAVSTIESLSAVILEECARQENADGAGMTVIFNSKGAVFYPNDHEQHLRWYYNRIHSQQWTWLSSFLETGLSHQKLLKVLQGMRPSIDNFPDLFRAFRRITVTDNSTMESCPIIEAGQMGESYNWNMRLETAAGGEQKVGIPSGFTVTMPFTRGGTVEYQFDIAIDVERKQIEKRFVPEYWLRFAEKQIIEDRGVLEEIDLLAEKTKGKSRLLTVLDFSTP